MTNKKCLLGAACALLASLLGASCKSAPETRPQPVCEPEVRLARRAVELVPLVATSPPLEAPVLGLVRRNFEQQLSQSGVFEIVNNQDRSGEFVVSGIINDVGQQPEAQSEDLSVDARDATADEWSLRLVVEVRAKADNHLIAVVGATVDASTVVAQSTGANVEKDIPDPRLRQGLMQVTAQVAQGLASRFGPGAAYQDPSTLDEETLVRQGKELYASGAYFSAESLFREALQRDADNAQVASLLGDIYYNRRDYVNAVKAYNAAIDVESNRFHDLALLGNAYYFLMDGERAEKVWEQALRLDPKGAHAKTLKGNLRRAKEQVRKGGRGRGLGEKSPEPGKSPAPSGVAGDEF
ncbi:MAG: tetratricopeptide repeat protein [Pseudomonadota bacterium]